MKKVLLALAFFCSAGLAARAQKTAPAKDFETRFTALFDFVVTEMSEADAKKAGFVGAAQAGVYPVKQGLPNAKDEQLMLVAGSQHWIYRSELGRFKAGQEAAGKAEEERLSAIIIAKIKAAGWVEVKKLTSSASSAFRTVLHYRNSDGTHNVRLKVQHNSKNEDVLQLYLE